MSGVITHVSDPNRRTACTTSLKKIPDTRGLLTSCPSILYICAQLFRAFQRFYTLIGQYLSAAIKIHPRYLNKVTVARCLL